MDDGLERTIDGVTVRIDRLLCVGFGDCIDEAPAAFELDDEGIAAFAPEAADERRERLLAACEACPVDALIALDAGGVQIAP